MEPQGDVERAARARSRRRARRVVPLVLSAALLAVIAAIGVATASGTAESSAIGAAPRLPRGSADLGAASAASPVSGSVLLRPRDEAGLEAFVAEATNRHSPEFGHYLARGEFASRFGPTAATVSAVEHTLESHGLHIGGVSPDGLAVSFDGTDTQAASAFATSIHRYRLPGGAVARATTSAPRLPSALGSAVTGVVGLDELPRPHPLRVRRNAQLASELPAAKSGTFPHPAGAPDACHAASAAAAAFGGLSDDQIAHAYGAFGLYGAGDDGAGVHIGVFEQEPFARSDIEHFDRCYFGAAAAAEMAARLTVVPLEGGIPQGPGAYGEALLDVEDVSAMAPGAAIDVYENPETAAGEVAQIAAMVDEDRDQIVTSSYGQACEQSEEDGQPGTQQELNFLFQQAAAQGQTFLGAAGDNGSDNCEEAHRETTPQPGQNPISTGEITSQPYVLAVGGTTITDAATEPAQEHVWNDGDEGGAGGGGISQAFAMPSWQRASRVPGIDLPGSADYLAGESVEKRFGYPAGFCDKTLPGAEAGTPCRLVPDVTAQADEYTGAVTVYSEEYRGNGEGEESPSGWVTSGGTSSSTPIWAGLLALADASPTCRSNPATAGGVGFVPPLLYAIASEPAAYAASFNDITEGNIDQYDLDGGKVYPARPGYDLASGLGSPRMTGPNGAAGLAYYLCSYASDGAGASVSGLAPTSGPAAGGETVTVTGSGFENGGAPDVAAVQVGTWHAAKFQVTSPTKLSITLPPALDTLPADSPAPQDGAGPAPVIVSLTDGRSSAPGPASVFEYYDTSAGKQVPSLTGLLPYGGSETAPAPVTIFGSGFGTAKSVSFGGVKAASFTAHGESQITVTPPAYSPAMTCAPLPTGGVYAGENASNDVCQVQVVVAGASGASTTAHILPPFEGAPEFEQDGALEAPAGCGCEIYPAVTEYDYVPAPTVTSVSTSAGASSLASETGGSLVTIHGTGLGRFTLDYAQFDDPELAAAIEAESLNEDIAFISGTEIQIQAPAIAESAAEATLEPQSVPFTVRTLAGESAPAPIEYAGVPRVSRAQSTASSVRLEGHSGASDTGGTPITVTGHGMGGQVTDVRFTSSTSAPSEGSQYVFTTSGETKLSTETASQNPALADVRVCSVTGCSATSSGDEIYLYPPGAPEVRSLSPAKGPAGGGTKVVIGGQNLGCPLRVSFGAKKAVFQQVEALEYCGSTTALDAVSPAGTPGKSVPVTVQTLESYFTGQEDVPPLPQFTYKG